MIISPRPTFNTRSCMGQDMPPPSTNDEPVAYFYLFYMTAFQNLIVYETNTPAQQFLQTHRTLSLGTTANKWTNVSLAEIRGFTACLLNMNIIK
jgi:hypothetical protein